MISKLEGCPVATQRGKWRYLRGLIGRSLARKMLLASWTSRRLCIPAVVIIAAVVMTTFRGGNQEYKGNALLVYNFHMEPHVQYRLPCIL
jgi:hypothetical protein